MRKLHNVKVSITVGGAPADADDGVLTERELTTLLERTGKYLGQCRAKRNAEAADLQKRLDELAGK